MVSTYTTNQGIEKPAAGDQSGTWGGTVNTNMDIIDRAICGVASLTLTGSTTTLTTTDGTLTDGMYRVLILGDSGDLGSDNTITISPNDQSKCYLVYNNLTADRNAIFTQGSGGNITVSNGATAWIYADGAGAGAEVRQGMVSTEIADQDGDTKIQVEEGGDDDDTIRFDIAGAEDFTMSANSLNILTGSVVALPDATVGAPALTNTGDLDTGVYFPGANELGIATSGTLAWTCDAAGIVTKSLQPAFLARPAGAQSNIAVASPVTVVFGTEIFDQNADFASNTFTAPVSGRYFLSFSLGLNAIDTACSVYEFNLNTSNRAYGWRIDPGVLASDPTDWQVPFSVVADMDASDTAYVNVYQATGTVQTDIATNSSFSGFLLG
jgi:hypothetical protein